MARYDELTLRNAGYVAPSLQQSIRRCRVLIAGCGVGSTIAEAATRLGFEHFVLADGDVVERHNLNRQAFCEADIGDLKTNALARRILAINPEAKVSTLDHYIASDNAASIVAGCDMVFDTIDFLDLSGIASLHDEANRQGKPVISAVSAGWGAVLMFCPPKPAEPSIFRRMFGLPQSGPVDNASYVERFGVLFGALSDRLSPEVVQAMGRALTRMEDGTPCPAPHVSAGSYSVAALAVTCAVQLLAGHTPTIAPQLIVIDLLGELSRPGVSVITASS
jgi:molybdopterin/thiamine biosynthesis adenylyltransferase